MKKENLFLVIESHKNQSNKENKLIKLFDSNTNIPTTTDNSTLTLSLSGVGLPNNKIEMKKKLPKNLILGSKNLLGNTYNNGRWSEEEHKKFVEAIFIYGNEWKEIQKHIKTRSSTQARSHAQKFFNRIQNKLKIPCSIKFSDNNDKYQDSILNSLKILVEKNSNDEDKSNQILTTTEGHSDDNIKNDELMKTLMNLYNKNLLRKNRIRKKKFYPNTEIDNKSQPKYFNVQKVDESTRNSVNNYFKKNEIINNNRLSDFCDDHKINQTDESVYEKLKSYFNCNKGEKSYSEMNSVSAENKIICQKRDQYDEFINKNSNNSDEFYSVFKNGITSMNNENNDKNNNPFFIDLSEFDSKICNDRENNLISDADFFDI